LAIDIRLTGGVDFEAYLDDFDANFSAGGFGFFSDGTSGDEYAVSASVDQVLPIQDGQAVIVDSGSAGDITYDMEVHVVSGFVDSVEFGEGVTDPDDDGDYQTDGAILISGLGLEGTGRGNDVSKLLGELLDGDSSFLRSLIAKENINLTGSAFADEFRGFGGNDSLDGGKGADEIYGDAGKDTIEGGSGNDQLFGEKSDDRLFAGDGNDTLNGGVGRDQMTGGAGKDVFDFDGANFGKDKILDFDAGKAKTDRISFEDGLFDSFKDVLAAAEDDSKGDVVITIDGDSAVTLVGVSVDDLRANDFLFG
jgi:serralysin